MNTSDVIEKLKSIDQQELVSSCSTLSDNLIHQIENLSTQIYCDQRKLLDRQENKSFDNLEPYQNYFQSGNIQDKEKGLTLLSKGLMGCLIVAGGQATRLKFDGPKGMYPLSLVKKKSLFQLFAEKVVAASKLTKYDLQLAIMTSPLNHDITVDFFKENHFFGLKPSQLSFFSQETLPFLDDNGNLFLENDESIAKGPNGNGLALRHFVESGTWKKWYDQGVRYLNFILIDNVLADPFDAELLGFHHRKRSDVVVKCTSRQNPEEKVGILTDNNGKVEVVEYTEIPDNDKFKSDACANISLFSFNMQFVEKVAKKQLPLHLAYKKALNLGKETMAWKFEYFIFDLLPLAKHVEVLLYPRERCFSPLKNASGCDSIETVQESLQNLDRKIYQETTSKPPPEHPFELSQDFYYPIAKKIEKIQKNCSNQSYIEV